MPLATHVTDRIPDQTMVEATNSSTTATTVDAAKLALAVTDVEADFEVYGNIVYDDTDARHVSVAVIGVFLKLLAYKQETADVDRYEAWQERLKEGLRMVTHNNRLLPKTNSQLTPSEEAPNGAIVRPWFDDVIMGDLIPTACRRWFPPTGGLGYP